MKILGRLSLGATALVALLGAAAGPAHAHEKWFVGGPVGGLRSDLLFRPLPLAIIGAVLVVTLLAGTGSLWGHQRAPQPALRAGAPDPRHPRRRAPARERRAGDALLPGQ